MSSRVAQRRVPELSVPATIRGLNLIGAVTWDTSQGILPAGRETKMDLMICTWAIHQGDALRVRWQRRVI